MSFEQFFETATSHPPFAYQRALGEETPEVLAVPTGSGKTAALIIPWLYRRREHGEGPRRLIYALPMRSLVEQTYEVALGFRERLALGETDLRVSVLMVGTQVAAAGVPMRTLQEWLGHRDIKTTMIYADYQESEHERELVEQAFRGPIRGPKLGETKVTSDDPTPLNRRESQPA